MVPSQRGYIGTFDGKIPILTRISTIGRGEEVRFFFFGYLSSICIYDTNFKSVRLSVLTLKALVRNWPFVLWIKLPGWITGRVFALNCSWDYEKHRNGLLNAFVNFFLVGPDHNLQRVRVRHGRNWGSPAPNFLPSYQNPPLTKFQQLFQTYIKYINQ